jgi:hypothetical protein
MTYRRAFERIDTTSRKELDKLNQDRDEYIEQLNEECKLYKSQLDDIEGQIESQETVSQLNFKRFTFEENQKCFEGKLKDLLLKFSRILDKKFDAIHELFEDPELKLRSNSIIDPSFVNSKAGPYDQLIDALQIMISDVQTKLSEERKHLRDLSKDELLITEKRIEAKLKKRNELLSVSDDLVVIMKSYTVKFQSQVF